MSLAVAPAEDYVVSGDALGNLRIWSLDDSTNVPESLRFQEPIRWIGFGEKPEQLLVQTEQWLHNLAIGDQLNVVESRLLPGGLVAGAANDGEGRWLLLGGLLRGRVSVASIGFDADSANLAATLRQIDQTPEPRTWNYILGLEFDGAGNAVPVIH